MNAHALHPPVHRVRLHPSEATVARKLRIEVGPEGQRVRVALGLGADTESAWARGWRLDAAGHAEGPFPLELSPSRSGRARAFEALRLEDEVLDARDAELSARRRQLGQLSSAARDGLGTAWANDEGALEDWLGLLTSFEEGCAELVTSELELERARESLERRREVLERSEVGEVEIQVPRSSGETPWVVEVTHRLVDAGWRLAYELRAKPSETPGEIDIEWVSLARVRQRSREMWETVEVQLCTSPPPQPRPAPRLSPVMLSGFQGPAFGPVAAMKTTEGAEASTEPPARVLEPAAPVSLPGTGEEIRVELSHRRARGKLRHEVRCEGPRVAWRVVETPLPEGWPAAELAVFWDGSFVGRAALEAPSDGMFRVDAGIEARVSVERVEQRTMPRRSRMGAHLEHARRIELRLADAGMGPVRLTLFGRLPVAGSSDVQVELEELPASTEVDPRTGHATTHIMLGEGAERSFVYRYLIIAPRNVVVDGPDP